MANSAAPLARLIELFERLPGIGNKSAQKLAFHILNMNDAQIKYFTDTITNAHEKIHRCEVCCDLTDSDRCYICNDEKRDGDCQHPNFAPGCGYCYLRNVRSRTPTALVVT